MSIPLLSVCLITYNHSKFIKEAIDSVLMQQVQFSWELIIADDFSTDGTREIVVGYKEKYPEFIKLILQEKNVGAAQNWMNLIDMPVSKYVAYLEGDDYWLDPYKLQKQVDFLESHPDFSICSNNVVVKNESGCVSDSEFLGGEHSEVISLEDLLLHGSGGATCSLLFRNRVFGDFPEWYFTLPGGDWTLQILCASKGKMRYFREPMGVYRTGHASNSMSTAIRQLEARGENPTGVAYKNTLKIIETLDEYFKHHYFSLFQNQRAYCYYNLALEYHNQGDMAAFRTYAWLVLKTVGKGHPFISNDRIFRLLLLFLPFSLNRLIGMVSSLKERIN